MQALQWAIAHPDRLRHCVAIATASKLSAQNIAVNEVARHAIVSDPDFRDVAYAARDLVPNHSLGQLGMGGHTTYQPDVDMNQKFGRELRSDELKYDIKGVEFQVESYLRYQGQEFSQRFDANTYLLMTKALDYYDPARAHGGDLARTLEPVQARCLVMSFSTDW